MLKDGGVPQGLTVSHALKPGADQGWFCRSGAGADQSKPPIQAMIEALQEARAKDQIARDSRAVQLSLQKGQVYRRHACLPYCLGDAHRTCNDFPAHQ